LVDASGRGVSGAKLLSVGLWLSASKPESLLEFGVRWQKIFLVFVLPWNFAGFAKIDGAGQKILQAGCSEPPLVLSRHFYFGEKGISTHNVGMVFFL